MRWDERLCPFCGVVTRQGWPSRSWQHPTTHDELECQRMRGVRPKAPTEAQQDAMDEHHVTEFGCLMCGGAHASSYHDHTILCPCVACNLDDDWTVARA